MANKNVEISTIVARSAEVIASQIDGEIVIMNVALGSYTLLDDIGSEVWDLLEKPSLVSGLCKELMERYDVKEDQCQRDLLGFLNELVAYNIIIADTDCARNPEVSESIS